MYYTVIKHSGHLGTLRKWIKLLHFPCVIHDLGLILHLLLNQCIICQLKKAFKLATKLWSTSLVRSISVSTSSTCKYKLLCSNYARSDLIKNGIKKTISHKGMEGLQETSNSLEMACSFVRSLLAKSVIGDSSKFTITVGNPKPCAAID